MITLILAVAVCAAAYGFLSAYALRSMRQDQLAAKKTQLHVLNLQHQELVRKTALLEQAGRFTQRARELGLEPGKWSFYDVQVREPLGYEAAQEIIFQCRDSSMAYFWPISLEITSPRKDPEHAGASPAGSPDAADVQLSVKGRFVARQ